LKRQGHGNAGRLQREKNNLALRDAQIAERVDEVQNPKGAMAELERARLRPS